MTNINWIGRKVRTLYTLKSYNLDKYTVNLQWKLKEKSETWENFQFSEGVLLAL